MHSFCGALKLIIVNGFLKIARLLILNGTADCSARSKNFLHCAFELLCQALVTHLACNVEDCVLGQVSTVLDVLGLLPVSNGLLELFDNQTGCVWHNINFGCTIL